MDFSRIYLILKVVIGLSTNSTLISKGTVLEQIQNTYLPIQPWIFCTYIHFFLKSYTFLFHRAGMQKPVLIYQFNLDIFVHILIFFLETDIQDQGGGVLSARIAFFLQLLILSPPPPKKGKK